MTYSITAMRSFGDCVQEKELQRARERAARLGGRLEVNPSGYYLEFQTRRAQVSHWRHVLRILSDAEQGGKK